MCSIVVQLRKHRYVFVRFGQIISVMCFHRNINSLACPWREIAKYDTEELNDKFACVRSLLAILTGCSP